MKFCVFLYLFDFFNKKFFSVILVLFSNFEAKRAKNGAKIKNVLRKSVLDLNFAPIKESVFLIFFKKVKFVVPYSTASWSSPGWLAAQERGWALGRPSSSPGKRSGFGIKVDLESTNLYSLAEATCLP